MAEHAHITPEPSRRREVGRRVLALGGVALAAAGLVAAAPASAGQPGPEPLATFDDFATMEFDAHAPGGELVLGTLAEWLEQAEHEYALLFLAMVAFQRDHVGSAEIAAKGPELLFEFVDGLGLLQRRYEGRLEVLAGAEARVVCGLARHAAGGGA